jgi:hydroxymethyl cephem carbamoyltransferase
LLAAPFAKSTEIELNRIKEREDYRPIAPVCLHEDAHLHFAGPLDSPHMLYFQRVTNPRLAAVTHADGSARAQTVRRTDNPRLHALLTAFKATTGTGVLCNTSLNFKGRGFINRTSDLMKYATARDISVVVINDRILVRDALRPALTPPAVSTQPPT